MTTPQKDAPRVTITHHPDVRRSLMLQKAYAEGLRSLVMYTACQQDVVDQATKGTPAAELEEGSPAEMAARLNDLLLPIVKGVGSERAWVLLGTESLQTYGGSGFLKEYPLEQYVRDAKIDTLYEGTTAIQGLDFFFRKIVKDQGVALGMLQKEIETTIGQAPEALKREAGLLAQAATDLKDMGEFMFGAAMGSLEKPTEAYKIGLTSTRLLLAAGDVVIGWLLLRAAIVAQARLEAGDASSSRAPCCRAWRRRRPSPSPRTARSWTSRRALSDLTSPVSTRTAAARLPHEGSGAAAIPRRPT